MTRGCGPDLALAVVGLLLAGALVVAAPVSPSLAVGLLLLTLALGALALRTRRPLRDLLFLLGALGPGLLAAGLTGQGALVGVGFLGFCAGLAAGAAVGGLPRD